MPVWLDQPFWADRLVRLGVSPATVPVRRLSVAKLAEAIEAAVADPVYRTNARALSRRINAEDGAAKVVASLERLGTTRRAGQETPGR